MKKIVIDARDLRGSSGRYIERLLHYLQEVDTDRSHRYTVLLEPRDFNGWEPTSKRFTKVVCPYKDFTFGEQLGLLRQLHKLKPDLVHFRMVQQPILYRGKVITTMQDLTTLRFGNPAKNRFVFAIKQWVYKWVNYIAAHKSAAILTISNFVKEDIARFAGINSRKITVTYEGTEFDEQVPEPVTELEGQRFIMYVGRPTPHKNLPRLIEAFVLLKKKHPELKLVLAGKEDANYRRIARDVRHKAIPDVIFTGFITDGQMRWLFERCQAYSFPSLSEGFGLPALEAMASGAPVASSNATCSPEVYGDAAHYFDPLDVEDMARAIDDILTKPALRQKLVDLGHKQVKKYSWRRMAEQTLAVYKQVLGEN